MKKTQGFTRL